MADRRAMNSRSTGDGSRRTDLSRRRFLMSGGVAAAAAAIAGCGDSRPSEAAPPAGPAPDAVIPFHGAHQSGIVTPQPRHLRFGAFDLKADSATELRELLRSWSSVAATLTAGRPIVDPDPAKRDTGETVDLSAASLTITFGLGPSLFERDGQDRLGLASRRPPALALLPAFGADALDHRRSDGDLAVQICSDDAQVAFHAFHALTNAARGIAEPRWLQAGFLGDRAPGSTSRNLLGFKDGSRNLATTDEAMAHRHLWAAAHDGAPWMAGGTYLVARRIRTVLDVWDATSTAGQEATIGRHKRSGAPLGGRHEHDRPDFAGNGPNGPTIPADAHMRLAAPESNAGAQLLRRGYNYDDGIDPDTAQVDAGLFFLCFQRDPRTQFVPIQRRLATNDALGQHLIHTASALFACPPGAASGTYVGQSLLEA
jgi:deferrochelatase/peroxidase EfeB